MAYMISQIVWVLFVSFVLIFLPIWLLWKSRKYLRRSKYSPKILTDEVDENGTQNS